MKNSTHTNQEVSNTPIVEGQESAHMETRGNFLSTVQDKASEFMEYVASTVAEWFDFSAQGDCVYRLLGICFKAPTESTGSSIFGFAEFIGALALLVVVYTITDVRYKFRVRIAPIPLYSITFFVVSFVGFGALVSDLWISSKWPAPDISITYYGLQFFFGFSFLLTALFWLYFAFIKPTKFNRWNAKRYISELYRYILKGSEAELPIIAHELERSAKEIIKFSERPPENFPKPRGIFSKIFISKKEAGYYAYETLLMIGTRRLCKYIISSAPTTAITFFLEFSETVSQKQLPVGQFVRNVSTEAILNKDSLLYHEDEGYYSGWIGYVRPFSKAVYGDYKLIEILSRDNSSPLDVDYKVVWKLDAEQYEVYIRVTLIVFEQYIVNYPDGCTNSYVLNRAFENLEGICHELYKINDTPDYYSTDISENLRNIVSFVRDIVRLLNRHSTPPESLKSSDEYKRGDIFDHVVNLIFEIILGASSVNSNRDTCWSIHYGSVWSHIFNYVQQGGARKIIMYRLRRALYDEIKELSESPNFKSARILAICLNVMGPVINENSRGKEERALHIAMISWLQGNYLELRKKQPYVAESCLIGSISFDEENNRIVKSYIRGLRLEEPTEFLQLSTN